MLSIKDNNLIKHIQVLGNETTCILASGAFLGDALNELPFGRINKTETGIGATTLEFKAPRNSIIVQPLKATAYLKAKSNNALYFGSRIGLQNSDTSLKKLRAYITNKTIEHKKIVVVADSLPKVIEELGDGSKDYFLLVDEIDCVQTDSTFRKKMEICIEYYIQHEKQKRALITATMLPFSNPLLNSEPLTVFQYVNPTRANVSFIHSEKVTETGYLEIIQMLKACGKNEKIVVAYNTVIGCLNLAENLVSAKAISPNDIKILCAKSADNEETVGGYFSELSTSTFPAALNFVTSAYFNGFDISEPYHIIVLSDINTHYTMMSEHNIVQVFGRCRVSLLSQTVIYNSINPSVYNSLKRYTLEQLIKSASKQKNSLECIQAQYEDDPLLKNRIEKTRELIIGSSNDNGYRFLKNDMNGNVDYSFLNIDAYLEHQRVELDIYDTPKKLEAIFNSKGYQTTFNLVLQQPKIKLAKSKKAKKDYKKLAQDVTTQIRNLPVPEAVTEVINTENPKGRARMIFQLFKDYHNYIDNTRLLELLNEFGGQPYGVSLKNLEEGIIYYLEDPTSQRKRVINHHFVMNELYDTETLNKKIKEVHKELNYRLEDENMKKAISHLKCLIEIVPAPVRTKNKSTPVTHNKVIGDNPFKLIKPKNVGLKAE